MPQKSVTVIAKPTHSCNLNCGYCYIDENAENSRMDSETLERLVEQTIEVAGEEGRAHFLWHGGEPLLMGMRFYEEVLELQGKHKGTTRIVNSIQTNGTLLTEDFAKFFKEHKFGVGLSLDGPSEMQDEIRPYKSKKGSFDDVLRGVNIAKEYGIGGGVIIVVNQKNKDRLAEVYDFLKKEKINGKLNPLIRSGKAIHNFNDLGITAIEYGKAMNDLFDIWIGEDELQVSLDPFDQLISSIVMGVPMGCSHSESCQNNFYSVGPEGDVYPCGRFDGDLKWRLGNINDSQLKLILEGERRKELLSRTPDVVEGCSDCEYVPLCNSGCLHNAYMVEGNINDRDYYCTAYKMMFGHIAKKLHEEFKKAEVGAQPAKLSHLEKKRTKNNVNQSIDKTNVMEV